MTHTLDIDAKLSLSETEGTCKSEQTAGWQLASIQHDTLNDNGQVFLINKAQFDMKLTDRLNELSFADAPAKIKELQDDESWTHICDSKIYVANHIKDVSVFGKQT